VERFSGAAPPRRSGRNDEPKRDEPELLGIEIERSGNGLSIVALAGELDLSTIPRLDGRLLEELGEREGVIIDLSRLTFIDSSGIGLLIKSHRAMNGAGAIHIVVAEGSQVERVFAIAGIGRALPLFLDRDEAIAAVGKQDA
jgi:anti-anti-sigma factor